MEDNMKNEDLDERHDEDVEEVETVKEPKISDVWKGISSLFGTFTDEKEESNEPSEKESAERIYLQKVEEEKQRRSNNLNAYAPYIDQYDEDYDFFDIISDFDAKDLSEEVLTKIKQSVRLLYDSKVDNPFSFIKRYLLNEHFEEITEKYMEAFESYKLPSNPGLVKTRPNDDSLDTRVDIYLRNLSDYFSETTEQLKYDLEKKFVELVKALVKPENFKIEKLHTILEELADELNQIWGGKAFNIKDLFYEPDIDYVINIPLYGYYPSSDYDYNDYDGIFCTWETKEEVPEKEVREYQKENRANIKAAIRTANERFVNEINKTFFPIDLYLVDFAKTIIRQSKKS
jgi:hypothetical protein